MVKKEVKKQDVLEEPAVEDQGIDGDELFEGLESVSSD